MLLGSMRRLFISASAAAVLIVVASGAVLAQSVKLVVAQGSDGALYLVTDHGRFTIMPVPISDDELNASIDLGTIDGGQFATAAPAPTPTSAPVAPTAAPTTVPTAAPAPTLAPTAAPFSPITLSGHGSQNTRSFHLPAGNYTSHWQLTCPSQGVFYSGTTLRPVDSSANARLQTNTLLPSGSYHGTGGSGDTNLYSLPEGDYYANVNDSGCNWAVEIRPL